MWFPNPLGNFQIDHKRLQVKGRPKVDFSWARSPAPQPQSRSPLAAVRSPQPEYRNPLAQVQIPQSASRSPLAAVQSGESEFLSPLVAALSTPPVPCQVCITMVMGDIDIDKKGEGGGDGNVVLKCDFDCDYNWLFRQQ